MTYEQMAVAYNRRLKAALELIVAELNKGQREKIVKNPEIKALLERYGIQMDAEQV